MDADLKKYGCISKGKYVIFGDIFTYKAVRFNKDFVIKKFSVYILQIMNLLNDNALFHIT